MHKRKSNKILLTVILFILFVSIVTIATTLILRQFYAEWWTVSISRPIRSALTTTTNLLPFSLTEILVYVVVISAIVLIILLLSLLLKKKVKLFFKTILIAVTIVAFFVSVYTVTVSCEYNRDAYTGPWQNATASKEEFLTIAKAYQKEYNQLAESMERDKDGNIIEKYTFEEISELVNLEIKKHADGDYLASTVASPKKVLSSEIMSYLGISGIYLSLTGEANINTITHYTSLPITIAHELSHSLQIMRENEANIFAFYVCLGSQNSYLRYSALQYGYSQLYKGIITLYSTDSEEYQSFIQGLNPLAQKDRAAAVEVWDKYQGFTNDMGDFFNNLYLKLSGITEGTGSYNVGDASFLLQPPVEPGGETIVVVEYSPIQKLFISEYFYRQNNN